MLVDVCAVAFVRALRAMPSLFLRSNSANVLLRSSIGERRKSSPSSSIKSNAQSTAAPRTFSRGAVEIGSASSTVGVDTLIHEATNRITRGSLPRLPAILRPLQPTRQLGILAAVRRASSPFFGGLRLVLNHLNRWWPQRRWDPPRPFIADGGSRDCELGRCRLGHQCG